MGYSQCKNIWSKLALLTIAVTWIWAYFNNKLWKGDQIVWDVRYYYEYLPASIVYRDLSLHFADKDSTYVKEKICFITAPNGKRVVCKGTMGMSYLYLPFFFIGHAAAWYFYAPQNGYSLPYHTSLIFGCLVYLLLGFFFLRKSLLVYFPDTTTAMSIVCIYFGTNLFYYSLFESLMPHVYLFSLAAIFIYLTIKWHQKPTWAISVFIGIVWGIMTLVRPTLILTILIFILFGFWNRKSLLEKISLFAFEKRKLILILFIAILPSIPQILYWKYATGQWLYDSYPGEKIYFSNPHLIDGLFSYRKGWLLYTPMMSLSLLGFFFFKKTAEALFFPVLIVFILSGYLVFSWWCWWYGGSFGLRAMIDFYGLLAFPLGALIVNVKKKVIGQIFLYLFCVLCIELNFLQTWQYKHSMIHYDSNTKESYWLHFGKTCGLPYWWDKLHPPDYEKAKRGEDEY